MRISEAISHPAIIGELSGQSFNDVQLDIGCGRGEFLIAAASQAATSAYIGVEVNQNTHETTLRKLTYANLSNASTICDEGLYFIESYVKSNSIRNVHVYFPTPYIKPLNQNNSVVKKLTSILLVHNFFFQCRRILAPGGSVRIVSDHLSYIRRARSAALEIGLHEVPWTSPINCKTISHLIGTGCEIEMINNGKAIYSIQLT